MGLMDKVKAQATQLAQKTQEAAQEGKSRLDQAQASRRGDVLLRQLGAAVFADRTGRGTADTQSTIDQLVNAISTHERENGLNLTQATAPPTGSPADQPGSAPDSGADQPGSAPDSGTWSAPQSGGSAGGSQQDAPGGFASGQTFFPPPED
jgi:type II secretory pathway pseudopilin PulG